MIGKRVWLVGGEKQLNKYVYCIEYMFTVDSVKEGVMNVMRGSKGKLLSKPFHLNGLPWFEALKKKHANFSIGLSKLDDGVVEEFERLMGLRGGFGEL